MRKEKFKLYDTAFKIGFVLTVIICLILNIYSIYTHKLGEIIFHPVDIGGFPFSMFEGQGAWIGVLANVIAIVFLSSCVGLIFRFVWSKFQEKSLK